MNNKHTFCKCIQYTLNVIASGLMITIYHFQCVEGLQDGLLSISNDPEHIVIRYKEIYVRVLKSLQDPRAFGQQWTNKQVTRFLTECRDDLRYVIDAVDTLIRAGLVNVPQYDLSLAQYMDNGLNYVAVSFSTQLVQLFLIEDRSNQFVSESDFANTIEMLAKIATHTRQPPEGVTNVIELLRQGHDQSVFFGDRAPAGPSVHIHNGILQVFVVC